MVLRALLPEARTALRPSICRHVKRCRPTAHTALKGRLLRRRLAPLPPACHPRCGLQDDFPHEASRLTSSLARKRVDYGSRGSTAQSRYGCICPKCQNLAASNHGPSDVRGSVQVRLRIGACQRARPGSHHDGIGRRCHLGAIVFGRSNDVVVGRRRRTRPAVLLLGAISSNRCDHGEISMHSSEPGSPKSTKVPSKSRANVELSNALEDVKQMCSTAVVAP